MTSELLGALKRAATGYKLDIDPIVSITRIPKGWVVVYRTISHEDESIVRVAIVYPYKYNDFTVAFSTVT